MDRSFNNLRDLLIKHEGMRLKPYRDVFNKCTIGVGRCLDETGITQDEAYLLLQNDMQRALTIAGNLSWFNSLSVTRQDVILSMIFNLGLGGLLEFKAMIQALINQNYNEAANQMTQSHWASQVGIRAIELSTMMRTGQYVQTE